MIFTDEKIDGGGIYKITNITNNKIYIGSTKNFKNRWKSHVNLLKNKKHFNRHLQLSWNKYGERNFKFLIIKKMKDVSEEKLLAEEQKYINLLNPFGLNGYNIKEEAQCGGSTSLTSKLVLEIKKHIYSGVKLKDIAKIFGVSRGIISNIKAGRTWFNVKYEISNPLIYNHNGVNRPMAKLNDEKVLEIKNMIYNGKTGQEIAKIFEVTPSIIYSIKLGKTWKHVKFDKSIDKIKNLPRGSQRFNSKLTEKQVCEIRNLLQEGKTYVYVANLYGISRSNVGAIKKYKTWKNI